MHSTFDEIVRIEERLLNEPPAQMQSVQNQNLQYEDCIRERLERDPKLRQQIKEYEGLAERAAEKALLLRQRRHDNIAKKVFPEAAGKVRAQALETMEELREARFQKLSNPAIWIDNETADVERVEPDIRFSSPWSPLHLSGSFRQEGRNTTHEWHQSYPIGAPYPHPGFDPWWTLSNNIWDAGVYELPGPFSQNTAASLLIRGTGGGAITFTINVDLAVYALHKGESDYAAFNGDGFLMFPGLALFGERIDV